MHVNIVKQTNFPVKHTEELRNDTIRLMDRDNNTIVNPAYVSVSPRVTKNLGNFESLQIGVMITLPCEPNEAAIRVASELAANLATEQIEKNFAAYA